jgi:hypothetical protein
MARWRSPLIPSLRIELGSNAWGAVYLESVSVNRSLISLEKKTIYDGDPPTAIADEMWKRVSDSDAATNEARHSAVSAPSLVLLSSIQLRS